MLLMSQSEVTEPLAYHAYKEMATFETTVGRLMELEKKWYIIGIENPWYFYDIFSNKNYVRIEELG